MHKCSHLDFASDSADREAVPSQGPVWKAGSNAPSPRGRFQLKCLFWELGTTGNTPSLDHGQIILLKAADRDHTQKLHDFYLCNSIMKRKRLFTTDPHGPWDSHMGVKSFTWTSSFQILQTISHWDLALANLLRQIEKCKDRVAGIREIKGQTVKMHPAPSGEFWTCFVP